MNIINQGNIMNNKEIESTVKSIMKFGAGFLSVALLLGSSFYTIEEGHVGIVKRFSEAKEQVNPGLHFKIPFADSIEEIEVRTRKSTENLPAATSEQMPVTATVSVNWTVVKTSAFDLFVDYGGLDQFENRILDTRLKSAAKQAISKYTAEQLIVNRGAVISDISTTLDATMDGFDVTLDSVQIDNIVLPKKYLNSIEAKQTEKNLADAEEHKLAKQAFTAQQGVNTSKAKADGINLVAAAEANAIKIKGLAEAEAIEAKAKALKSNPLIVELTKAQQWDGQLPKMVTGESGMILQIKQP